MLDCVTCPGGKADEADVVETKRGNSIYGQ